MVPPVSASGHAYHTALGADVCSHTLLCLAVMIDDKVPKSCMCGVLTTSQQAIRLVRRQPHTQHRHWRPPAAELMVHEVPDEAFNPLREGWVVWVIFCRRGSSALPLLVRLFRRTCRHLRWQVPGRVLELAQLAGKCAPRRHPVLDGWLLHASGGVRTATRRQSTRRTATKRAHRPCTEDSSQRSVHGHIFTTSSRKLQESANKLQARPAHCR